MSDFVPGLEGVVAFETEIAEPDKEGGALRYRGVDIEDLVGHVSFGNVWGLLVDGAFNPGLPPAEPFPIPVHSGDIRVDVQSALAMLAPVWGLKPLLDIDGEQARADLARAAVMALSYVAQSARGQGLPMVPQREIDKAQSVVERFMIRWRGEPDPKHVAAVDAYWTSAAEHGMNASTFTARVIASTGADVAAALSGAVGAMSGPLHGGAPSRVLGMIEEIERTGDAEAYVRNALDKGERLMGFGHRVYRAEDPRARVLRRTARELGAPRFEVAEALEKAARALLLLVPPCPRIEPHGPPYELLGLPVVAWPHMCVQEPVGVPENLQIDPPEPRLHPPAGPLDGFSQPVHVGQERQPPAPRQLRQPLHRGIIGQQHRVAGQELHITDHREPGVQPPHHGRVLTPQGAPDPVLTPRAHRPGPLGNPQKTQTTRESGSSWGGAGRTLPATRGSGDCWRLGRLRACFTRWSGTALCVVTGR